MFKFFLFCMLFFTRAANAQMAVIDTNGLAESIKQNATMAAILENGKAIWDTTKEGLDATKQITDTVGGAVSLALTAQSFITNANELLQCVTPDLLLDGVSFEVTNVCTAQDYIRQALDLPTNDDVQGALTVMEKLSQTNRALADIHAALVQQNILTANILQIIAAKEKLVEGTIAIDAALTQEEKKK